MGNFLGLFSSKNRHSPLVSSQEIKRREKLRKDKTEQLMESFRKRQEERRAKNGTNLRLAST